MLNGKNIFKYFILFFIGGFTYYCIEILYRGYSHWSMIIIGGLAFILIGCINEFLSWKTPLWKQCLIATGIVLVLEFICGCIVNLWLGWNIWNYSDQPYNILGQVCILYSAIWYGISIFAIILDDFLRWLLFRDEFMGYKLI